MGPRATGAGTGQAAVVATHGAKIGEIKKGVGNRSGSQDQSKVEKIQKARYAIGNVSMKEPSNKFKEFEKLSRYLM